MLSPDDEQLVSRDTSLPYLGLVLDADALKSCLSECLNQAVLDLQTAYIRYKVATSVLVGFTARLQAGLIEGHAIHVHPDQHFKHEKPLSRGSQNNLCFRSQCIAKPGLLLRFFPNDAEITRLSELQSDKLSKIVRRTARQVPALQSATFTRLAYKPERRFVGKLAVDNEPVGVLRAYSMSEYHRSDAALKSGSGDVLTSQLLGASDHYQVRVYRWMHGNPFAQLDPAEQMDALDEIGRSLARWHRRTLVAGSQTEHFDAGSIRDGILALAPDLRERVDRLLDTLAASAPAIVAGCVIHGDLHPGQILTGGTGIAFIDLDEARMGNPAEDIGTLLARMVSQRNTTIDTYSPLRERLLSGYSSHAGNLSASQVDWFFCVAILRLCVWAFRERKNNWRKHILSHIALAEAICGEMCQSTSSSIKVKSTSPDSSDFDTKIQNALSGESVSAFIARTVSDASPATAKLIRLKPGRRAVVEYRFSTPRGEHAWLGKIRAKGVDHRSYEMSVQLLNHGFESTSSDRISTPEAICMLPELNMVLYTRVSGTVLGDLLESNDATKHVRSACAAIAKLHASHVTVAKKYTVQDEMDILRRGLTKAQDLVPDRQTQIAGVLAVCEQSAARLVPVTHCPIHRDFYQDQLLLDGDRCWLLDLDLVSYGDPAIDYANFIAHLIELDIRLRHKYESLRPLAMLVAEAYERIHGLQQRNHLQQLIYISLARHLYLSRIIQGRAESFDHLLLMLNRNSDSAALSVDHPVP